VTGGDRERIWRDFLGEVEVAEEPGQGGEDAASFLTEQPTECRYQ
jgi:hypothetical protein